MDDRFERYCYEQAQKIAALLVTAKVIDKFKEAPAAALLSESLKKRFNEKAIAREAI